VKEDAGGTPGQSRQPTRVVRKLEKKSQMNDPGLPVIYTGDRHP
jgi:hypothetical protein